MYMEDARMKKKNWSTKRHIMKRYNNAFELIGVERSDSVHIRCCSFLKRTRSLNGLAINQNIYSKHPRGASLCTQFSHGKCEVARVFKANLWCYCDTRVSKVQSRAWDSNQRKTFVIPKMFLWIDHKLLHTNKSFFPIVVWFPIARKFPKTFYPFSSNESGKEGNIQKITKKREARSCEVSKKAS